jgi:hypothetical protein
MSEGENVLVDDLCAVTVEPVKSRAAILASSSSSLRLYKSRIKSSGRTSIVVKLLYYLRRANIPSI